MARKEGAGARRVKQTHLRKEDYTVEPIDIPSARRVLDKAHYMGGNGSVAVYLHGLYRLRPRRKLVGVAWWLPPPHSAAKIVYPSDHRKVLALSRLAVLKGEPTNAASYLLGRSIRLIRQDGRFDCLLTFANTRLGHTGAIYKATNWEYMGTTRMKMGWIDPKTGKEVQRLKGRKRPLNQSEFLALGYIPTGKYVKHRFRMILR